MRVPYVRRTCDVRVTCGSRTISSKFARRQPVEHVRPVVRLALQDGQDSTEGQRKPLESDLGAIRVAGNEHPFVNAILDAFPEESKEQGVWTESALEVCFRIIHDYIIEIYWSEFLQYY